MSGATIAAGVLKALAMDLSSLEQLPSAVTAGAADVEEANFSFNAIAAESLHALAPFKNLKTLVLDNNELSSLRELPSLPQLRTLWVNNNGIDDLEETLNVLSRHCPQLEYLSLLRNPCCPNELIGKQETEYRRYRLYAKYRLPTLKILDTGKFTEQEATDAREKGKFLRNAFLGSQTSSPTITQTSSPKKMDGTVDGHDPLREPPCDLFERHSKKLLRTPTSTAGTPCGATSDPARERSTIEFGGKMDVLCDAKLGDAGHHAGGVGFDDDDDGSPSAATSSAVFSEQKSFASTALCVGNRYITDDAL